MRKNSGRQLDLGMKEVKGSNGANLGFEQMWKAADRLLNNMDVAR